MRPPEPRIMLLECLHTCHITGVGYRIGDVLRCERCGLDMEIVKIDEPFWEYEVRCQTCRYAKKCGKAASLGQIIGSKHRIATGHDMRLRKIDQSGLEL